MSVLFSRPKIPKLQPPEPPHPVRNTVLEAQLAQMGRRQGLLAALFGFQNPSGRTLSHTITGQGQSQKTMTGQ